MRYELKFKFNENEYNKLNLWLSKNKIKKKFSPRQINNIYYDDIFLSAANDNIVGLPNRQKYRLRWYGNFFNNETFPNFEIKIKKNRLNYKKIFPCNIISKDMNKKNIFNRQLNYFNKIISKKKIEHPLMQFHNVLFPVISSSYHREYYTYKNNVRITIDKLNNYLDFKTNQEFHSFQKIFVLEIKFDPNYLALTKEIIKDIPFNISRFSKYIYGLNNIKKVSFY